MIDQGSVSDCMYIIEKGIVLCHLVMCRFVPKIYIFPESFLSLPSRHLQAFTSHIALSSVIFLVIFFAISVTHPCPPNFSRGKVCATHFVRNMFVP